MSVEDDECLALQEEEAEVLKSIYEGDPAFTILSSTKYQYKVGDQDVESGGKEAFMIEFEWSKEYPNVLPTISMNIFFNRLIVEAVKSKVVEAAKEEAEQYLGMSMTYTIIEFVKENYESWMDEQPEAGCATSTTGASTNLTDAMDKVSLEAAAAASKKAPTERKEQLTKAQKRRMWEKGGLDVGDRERGWNWVDVIRHLSQTGFKPDDA